MSNRDKQVWYWITTSAISGNISTQSFGEKYDADWVMEIDNKIRIYAPFSGDKNTTISLNIQKNSITEIDSDDMLMRPKSLIGDIDKYSTHWSRNFSYEDIESTYFNDTLRYHWLELHHIRTISEDEINSITLDVMPGFRLTWSYNEDLKSDDWFGNTDGNYKYINKDFIRL